MQSNLRLRPAFVLTFNLSVFCGSRVGIKNCTSWVLYVRPYTKLFCPLGGWYGSYQCDLILCETPVKYTLNMRAAVRGYLGFSLRVDLKLEKFYVTLIEIQLNQ